MRIFKIKKIFNFLSPASYFRSERGASLYFVLLIMGILLAMSLTLSTLSILQFRAIKGIGDSVVAFYAANTGIERAIYTARRGRNPSEIVNSINALCPKHSPCSLAGAEYFIEALLGGRGGCPENRDYCIESIGTYRGVRRAVRVSM